MTSSSYATLQEQFWAGDFGNRYILRNQDPKSIATCLAQFSTILARTSGVDSIIEFGANIGLNLHALRQLRPESQLAAVEINPQAAAQLRTSTALSAHVFEQSILDFVPGQQYDLSFTKGVLIHIAPEALPQVYDKLYQASRRFILIAEYYSPAPQAIPYRGHDNLLFKRDFAGEMLERHPDLRLLDYGFFYRRDPNFPDDDINWFLLEKAGADR